MIQIDTREHAHAIRRILETFDETGVEYFFSKLYVGDYQRLDNGRLVVDRKKDLQEIAGNVTQQHERFRRELERARDAKIRLVILCEHGGQVRSVSDVERWQNPRLKKNPGALTGERLAKIMRTMANRYGIRWEFCDKRQTGKRILDILQEGHDGKE